MVIVGGPDGNTLTGGSGINWIAGNGGGDIITASGAQNYIFGDSSFIVGEAAARSTFDNADVLCPQSDRPDRDHRQQRHVGRQQRHHRHRQRPERRLRRLCDDADRTVRPIGIVRSVRRILRRLARGHSDHRVGQHALGGNNIINVNNVNSTDIVIGGAGDDRIILGSGGQNIVLGDNGEIDYTYNATTQTDVLTSIESIDPAHGGDDVISGQWVTGLPTARDIRRQQRRRHHHACRAAPGRASAMRSAKASTFRAPGTNGNGATFTGSNYYTIAAISNAARR